MEHNRSLPADWMIASSFNSRIQKTATHSGVSGVDFGIFRKKTFLFSAFSACNVLTMVDSLVSYYLLDFLVYHAGIPGSVAGGILFVSEAIEILFGPAISAIMDKVPFSSFGTHRAYILISLVPFVLTSIGMWWQPKFLPPLGRQGYYLVVIILFNFAYTVLLIAYESMIPLLSEHEDELERVNSARLGVGSVSSVLSLLLAATSLSFMRDQGNALFSISIVIGVIIFVLFLGLVAVTRETSPYDPGDEDDEDATFFQMLRGLMRRPAFNILLLNHFCFWMVMVFSTAALPAYVRDYLRFKKAAIVRAETVVPLIVQASAAVPQVLMGIFPEDLDPDVVIKVGMSGLLLSKLSYFFLFQFVPSGMIPTVAVMDGMFLGATYACCEMMIAEVVLDDYQRTGDKKEHVVYGIVDSVREASMAVAFFATGLFLPEIPGQDNTPDVQGTNDVGPDTLHLRLLCGLFPLLVVVVWTILRWYYPYILVRRRSADDEASLLSMTERTPLLVPSRWYLPTSSQEWPPFRTPLAPHVARSRVSRVPLRTHTSARLPSQAAILSTSFPG